ncbi:MAG: 50S ribosomal protein L7ae-like protein [Oscillospiraceae bacterium]|jgi:ribosomal protein L7Ae-like RNA K-turn-binding protein|nr:50S ribosomal protein L7ae-like protein [Oscillospiraceae bacterium]
MPHNNNDKFLTFLGLCKKAGALETGEERVALSQKKGKAKLILIASDAAENTRSKAAQIAEWGKLTVLDLPYTKEIIGGAVGTRACAILSVTTAAMAKAVREKLTLDDTGKSETDETTAV